MAAIISNPGSLVLDGLSSIPRGSYSVSSDEDKVYVHFGPVKWTIDLTTTIDGATAASIPELVSLISSFSKGGGDGQGVTQDQLNERAPELSEGNFLVGGSDGNEQRKVLPSDLTTSLGTGGDRIIIFNGTTNTFSASNILTTALGGNTAAKRTAAGTLQAVDSVSGSDLVTLNQFRGIVNDALSNAETSATLNAAYPSIAVGISVRTITNLTKYTKINATQWEKTTIVVA